MHLQFWIIADTLLVEHFILTLLVFESDFLFLPIMVYNSISSLFLSFIKSLSRLNILIDKFINRDKSIIIFVKHLKKIINYSIKLQLVRDAFCPEEIPQLLSRNHTVSISVHFLKFAHHVPLLVSSHIKLSKLFIDSLWIFKAIRHCHSWVGVWLLVETGSSSRR